MARIEAFAQIERLLRQARTPEEFEYVASEYERLGDASSMIEWVREQAEAARANPDKYAKRPGFPEGTLPSTPTPVQPSSQAAAPQTSSPAPEQMPFWHPDPRAEASGQQLIQVFADRPVKSLDPYALTDWRSTRGGYETVIYASAESQAIVRETPLVRGAASQDWAVRLASHISRPSTPEQSQPSQPPSQAAAPQPGVILTPQEEAEWRRRQEQRRATAYSGFLPENRVPYSEMGRAESPAQPTASGPDYPTVKAVRRHEEKAAQRASASTALPGSSEAQRKSEAARKGWATRPANAAGPAPQPGAVGGAPPRRPPEAPPVAADDPFALTDGRRTPKGRTPRQPKPAPESVVGARSSVDSVLDELETHAGTGESQRFLQRERGLDAQEERFAAAQSRGEWRAHLLGQQAEVQGKRSQIAEADEDWARRLAEREEQNTARMARATRRATARGIRANDARLGEELPEDLQYLNYPQRVQRRTPTERLTLKPGDQGTFAQSGIFEDRWAEQAYGEWAQPWGLSKKRFEQLARAKGWDETTTRSAVWSAMEEEYRGTSKQGYTAYHAHEVAYQRKIRALSPEQRRRQPKEQQGVLSPTEWSQLPEVARLRLRYGEPIAELGVDDYNKPKVPTGSVWRRGTARYVPLEAIAAGELYGPDAVVGYSQEGNALRWNKFAKAMEQRTEPEIGISELGTRQVRQLAGRASTVRERLTPTRTMYTLGPVGAVTGTGWYDPEQMKTRERMSYRTVNLKRGLTEEQAREEAAKYYMPTMHAEIGEGFGPTGRAKASRWWAQDIVESTLLHPEKEGGRYRVGLTIRQSAPLSGGGGLARAIRTKSVLTPMPSGGEITYRRGTDKAFRAWSPTTIQEAKDPSTLAYGMWSSIVEQASRVGDAGEREAIFRQLARNAGVTVEAGKSAQAVLESQTYASMAPGVLRWFGQNMDEMVGTMRKKGFRYHESLEDVFGGAIVKGTKRKVRGQPGLRQGTLEYHGLIGPRELRYEMGGRMRTLGLSEEVLQPFGLTYGRKADEWRAEYMRELAKQNPEQYEQMMAMGRQRRSDYRAFTNAQLMTEDPGAREGARGKVVQGSSVRAQLLDAFTRADALAKEEGIDPTVAFQRIASEDRGLRRAFGDQMVFQSGDVSVVAPAPKHWGIAMTADDVGDQVNPLIRDMMAVYSGQASAGEVDTQAQAELITRLQQSLEEQTGTEKFQMRTRSTFLPTGRLVSGGFPVTVSELLAPNEFYDPALGAMIDARYDEYIKAGMSEEEAQRKAGTGVAAHLERSPEEPSAAMSAPGMEMIGIGKRAMAAKGGNTEIGAVSLDIIQALAGDADGEAAAWYLSLTSDGQMRFARNEQGKWVDVNDPNHEYGVKELQQLAVQRYTQGAQYLRGMHSERKGTREETAAEFQAKFMAASEASVSYKKASEIFMQRQALFGQVGPNYNTWRKLYPLARGEAESQVANKLHSLSHEISQRPEPLTPQLQAFQNIFRMGLKGWGYDAGTKAVEQLTQLRGVTGMMQYAGESVMNLAAVREMQGKAGLTIGEAATALVSGKEGRRDLRRAMAADIRAARKAGSEKVVWSTALPMFQALANAQEGGMAGSLIPSAVMAHVGKMSQYEYLQTPDPNRPGETIKTRRTRTQKERMEWLTTGVVGFSRENALQSIKLAKIQDAAMTLASKSATASEQRRAMQIVKTYSKEFPNLTMLREDTGWIAGLRSTVEEAQARPNKAVMDYLMRGQGLGREDALRRVGEARAAGTMGQLKEEGIEWHAGQAMHDLFYGKPSKTDDEDAMLARARGGRVQAARKTGGATEMRPLDVGALDRHAIDVAKTQAGHLTPSFLGQLDAAGTGFGEKGRAHALMDMAGAVREGKARVVGGTRPKQDPGPLTLASTMAEMKARKDEVGPSRFGTEVHEDLLSEYVLGMTPDPVRGAWVTGKDMWDKLGVPEDQQLMSMGSHRMGFIPDLMRPWKDEEGRTHIDVADVKPAEYQGHDEMWVPQTSAYGYGIAKFLGQLPEFSDLATLSPEELQGRIHVSGAFYGGKRGAVPRGARAEMEHMMANLQERPTTSHDELVQKLDTLKELRGSDEMVNSAAFLGTAARSKKYPTPVSEDRPYDERVKLANDQYGWLSGESAGGVPTSPFVEGPGGTVESAPPPSGGGGRRGGGGETPPRRPRVATGGPDDGGGDDDGGDEQSRGGGRAASVSPGKPFWGRTFGKAQYRTLSRMLKEVDQYIAPDRGLMPGIQEAIANRRPLTDAQQRFMSRVSRVQHGFDDLMRMDMGGAGLSDETRAMYSEALSKAALFSEDDVYGQALDIAGTQSRMGKDFSEGPLPADRQARLDEINRILRGSRADVDEGVTRDSPDDTPISEGPTKMEKFELALETASAEIRGMTPAVRAAVKQLWNLETQTGKLSDQEKEAQAGLKAFVKAAGVYMPKAGEYLARPDIEKETAALAAKAKTEGGLSKKEERRLQGLESLMARGFDPESETVPQAAKNIMAARQAFQEGLVEEDAGLRAKPFERRTWEDFGVAGGAAKVMGDLTSGWELFRLKRMWQMTGGPVFSEQIPTAAKAEMAYWQAANVAGGYTPGTTPGGAAGGLMATEAMKQWQTIQAGQLGYRAWGGTMGITSGLKGIQALLGPAAGIGLVGGSIATTIGTAIPSIGGLAAASTMIGLPVTLGLGALATGYGLTKLGESYAQPTATNRLELASEYRARGGKGEGGGYWKRGAARLGRITELTSGENPIGLIPAWKQSRQYADELTREGYKLYNTPIEEMKPGERAAAFMQTAKDLAAKPGTQWEGADPTQLAQIIAEQAPYENISAKSMRELLAAGTAQNPLGGMPESISIALATGKSAANYQPLADALLGGRELANRMLKEVGTLPAEQEADILKILEQQSYRATLYGTSGDTILNSALAGSLTKRTGVGGYLTGQLGGAAQSLAGAYGLPYTSDQVKDMMFQLETIAGAPVGRTPYQNAFGQSMMPPYATEQEQLKAWEDKQTALQYNAPILRATGHDRTAEIEYVLRQNMAPELMSRFLSAQQGALGAQWGLTSTSPIWDTLRTEGVMAAAAVDVREYDTLEQANQYAASVFKARGAAAGDPLDLVWKFKNMADMPNFQAALASNLQGQYAQAAGVAPESAQGKEVSAYFKSITDKAITPSYWTTGVKQQQEAETQRELEQEEITYQYASAVFKQRGGDVLQWQERAKRYTDPDDLQRWAEAVNGAMFEQLGMVLGSATQEGLERYAEESLAGSELATSAWKMGLSGAVNVAQMRGMGEQDTLGLTQRFQTMAAVGISPQAMSIIQQQMLGAGAVSQAMGLPAYLGGNYEAGLQAMLSTGRMSPVRYQGIAGLLGATMNQTGYSALTGAFGKGLQGQWQAALGMLGQFGINVPMPTGQSPIEVVNGGIYGLNELAMRSLQQQSTLGTGQWATAQATPWNAMQWQKNVKTGQMEYAPVLNAEGQQVQYGGGTYQMGMIGDLGQMQKDYGTWKQTTAIGNKLADLSAASSMQGLIQSLENLELSYRKFQANTAFQRQEMGIQWTQMQTQQQWGREDVAFGRMTAGLQYGWQQEDYDREIRYATGRQKRQLMRERDRAQEMYAIQEGRRGTEEERMETQFQWQEEAYARQKAHFEEMTALEAESFELQKKHIGERMAMLGAQTALQKQLREIEQAAQDEKYLRAIAEKENSIEQTKLQYGLSNAQAEANAQMQYWLTQLASVKKMLESFFQLMTGGTPAGVAGSVGMPGAIDWSGEDPTIPVNQGLTTKSAGLSAAEIEAAKANAESMLAAVKEGVTAITPGMTALWGEEGLVTTGMDDMVKGFTTILGGIAEWLPPTLEGFEKLFGEDGLALQMPEMLENFRNAIQYQKDLVKNWLLDLKESGTLYIAWRTLISKIETLIKSVTVGGAPPPPTTPPPPPPTEPPPGDPPNGPVKGPVGITAGQLGYAGAATQLYVPPGPSRVNQPAENIIEHILKGGAVGNSTIQFGQGSIVINVPQGDYTPEEIARAVFAELEQKTNELAARQRRKGDRW